MPVNRLKFFLVFVIVLLVSCGKPSDKNLCGGVDCEFGVCESSSGECVNPSSCDDSATCLDGFECVQDQCIAEFACESDGTCDRGECVDDACVNPERCSVANDCVPGFACDGDRCVEDRCARVECDRGVCEKATGDCVNAAVCTAETEETDCVEDSVCYDQTCTGRDVVCEEIDCARGVCSIADLACVNAEGCEGDDQNCLEGHFCNAADQCQRNVCSEDMVDCPRGVCEPSTGSCINAEECTAADECTDGFFCIDSACEEQTAACEVCNGNQICSYDEGGLQVVCEESPDGCDTTLDCVDSRVCVDGECGEPSPCEADAFEPNDSRAEATDWFTVAGGIVDGTICSGDADFFSFDLAQHPEFTGTLLAIVNIPVTDVGVGTLELELTNEDGAVVASTTSGLTDSVIRVEYTIGNINQGVYTLEIRDSGDVGSGGIEYSLFMDLANENAVEACANAETIGGTVMGDTSSSSSNSLGSACVNDSTASEEIWTFDVAERSFATISVTGASFDAVISLRTQCEADSSELGCANDAIETGDEQLGLPVDSGSYYVVVQGASGAEQGSYTLDVEVDPIICDQSDNNCVDANTSDVCNGRGTGFVTVACDSGCDMATGNCIREVADVCTTAIDANGGFTGSISLGLLEPDYDPGACVPEGSFTGSATVGPDAVFSVSLDPDDVVHVTATPVGSDNVSLYIVDDCTDVESACLAGVNDSQFGGAEELVFVNSSGAVRDVYVMLDSAQGASGDIDVEIVTGPQICTPGMEQCNGSDLETCNIAGTGYDAKVCNFGCDAMAAACEPPPNDTCGPGAIDVSAGGQFTGVIDDYTNNYSDASNCTGFSANGFEAVYVVSGTPGDIVNVTLDAPYDASLYAVTSCGDIANTCLAGSDNFGLPEEITFVIPDADPVYIIADAFTSSPSGTFTLDVTVETPDCTNYEQAIMCQADGVTLQYCDSIGHFADYTCSTTCSSASCDDKFGDRCFDAIPMADGDSFTGSYADYTNALDPGVGTCILKSSDDQPGSDAIFSVDLVVGDLLTATLDTTDTGGSMYVLSDCGDPRGTCERAAPNSDTLQFFASAGGTYFLVVDSTRGVADADFTLDIEIEAGLVCLPGGATCDEPSDTLSFCNDDGTAVTSTHVCSDGCSNDYCKTPTALNDTCMDATVVDGPIRIFEDYDRFANDLDPASSATNTCDLTGSSSGSDAVYEVTLAAGEVVDVTVEHLESFGNPLAYIVTDCSDPANSCVASDETGSTVRAGYVSELGETVYVVADASSSFTSGNFMVDIDIRPSECTANSQICLDPNTREYCDPFGQLQTESCYFGCTNGACEPPTNNTCSMPVDATGGGTFTIPIDDYTNDYDPTFSGCTGFAAAGPEGVFQVTAAAGDIITARLQSSDYDTSLYATSICGDTTTCIDGHDSATVGAVEEVQFVAQTAGDYFIYADSFTTTPSGEFTLEVLQEQPICTPGEALCDSMGANIEVCNSVGTGYTVYPCDSMGCAIGAEMCANSTGEYCVDAFDANALGQFTGVYADYKDDYDLSSASSCTGFSAPGPDVVYFVDLLAGETLDATLNGTEDTSLYFVDNCAAPFKSCLAGADVAGSGEMVSYTAPDDMRVYVVVDAFTSTASGMYTLDLSVN